MRLRIRRIVPTGVLVLSSMLCLLLLAKAVAGDKESLIKIGMNETFYRDTPEKTVKASAEPFRNIMKRETDREGEIVKVDGFDKLGKMLTDDELELGVFHGIEFGWARQKYPKLSPLVLAVNQNPHLTAHLMVRQDNPAANLGDVKGKSLALPEHSQEHTLLYLERHPALNGQDSKQFFSKLTTPPNIEDALDDLVDGGVQAAMVDGVALERYKTRKPARFRKLKEIDKSDASFPTSVVAYHEGALNAVTLRKFRKALLTAAGTAEGDQLLTLWKITGFHRVPRDYQPLLDSVVKKYPPKTTP